jgi:hypothetical protein
MSTNTTTKARNTSPRNSRNTQQSKTDKESALTAAGSLELARIAQQEAAGIAPLPGNRPIASSNLQISETMSILGNRPVDAGNLEVMGTISAMGERPIFASNMKVWDTISVSGNRPIASSNMALTNTDMIFGNRPIASNDMDVYEDLMGYLD